MTLTASRLSTQALLFITLLTAMTLLGHWHAKESLKAGIKNQLEAPLLQQLEDAELYSFEDWEAKVQIAHKIEADLAELCSGSWFQILQHCHIKVLEISNTAVSPKTAAPLSTLSMTTANRDAFSLGLYYTTNWFYLLGSQILLLAVCWWLTKALLQSKSALRRKWIDKLRASGMGIMEAQKISAAIDKCSTVQLEVLEFLTNSLGIDHKTSLAVIQDQRFSRLSDEQQKWFYRALGIYEGSIEKAFRIALAKPDLVFHPDAAKVSIHGIDIALPRTPFIYYYWYALRRASASDADQKAWFTNPPINRSDSIHSDQLVALLERYGGHKKAINDLTTKGLRAKTLDQNRSKIKEEVTRVLGQELAAGYLFDVERDERTARYRYRVSVVPGNIRISASEPDKLLTVPANHWVISPAA